MIGYALRSTRLQTFLIWESALAPLLPIPKTKPRVSSKQRQILNSGLSRREICYVYPHRNGLSSPPRRGNYATLATVKTAYGHSPAHVPRCLLRHGLLCHPFHLLLASAHPPPPRPALEQPHGHHPDSALQLGSPSVARRRIRSSLPAAHRPERPIALFIPSLGPALRLGGHHRRSAAVLFQCVPLRPRRDNHIRVGRARPGQRRGRRTARRKCGWHWRRSGTLDELVRPLHQPKLQPPSHAGTVVPYDLNPTYGGRGWQDVQWVLWVPTPLLETASLCYPSLTFSVSLAIACLLHPLFHSVPCSLRFTHASA